MSKRKNKVPAIALYTGKHRAQVFPIGMPCAPPTKDLEHLERKRVRV